MAGTGKRRAKTTLVFAHLPVRRAVIPPAWPPRSRRKFTAPANAVPPRGWQPAGAPGDEQEVA